MFFYMNQSKLDMQQIKADLLSGLTVALALVPEAVAFAFVAGVDPMVGLYAAFIMGFCSAVFGGRPGMISGATGAMAVVMVSLVLEYNVQYLFAAVLLAGMLQILAGIFSLGKFIRMVPRPVMIGFVNGLAIVIFLSQLSLFKTIDASGATTWMQGVPLYTMAGLVVLTMAIIHFFPKVSTAVPSSLVAIVSVTLLVQLFGLEANTVLDFVKEMSGNDSATLAGSVPQFAMPAVDFNLETLWIILPYSLILAAVGLIESLLTLTLIDEITSTRGHGNRECVGQGIGNVLSSVFGAMGGCAMIGQSMININSGGRTRISGIFAAVALFFFVIFAAGLIEIIAVPALVGVMFMVVIGTFEWTTFKLLKKVPKKDIFVIILVTAVTVMTDLAIAVMVGVIASALIFAWEAAQRIHVSSRMNTEGSKEYLVHGPVFFGSSANFLDLFDVINDPEDVIVDFAQSRVADHSAIEALNTLTERYQRYGKTLHLRHLSPDCRALLQNASSLIEVNLKEDPTYKVATDLLADS